MNKKILIVAVLCLFVTIGCKSGKYGDIKEFVNETIQVQNQYVESIKNAGSAADVAKAINAYADGLVDISRKGETLQKKYPELEKGETPAELKEDFAKLEKSASMMASKTMPVMQKYIMNPAVMKASMEMSKKMQKMSLLSEKK